MKLKKIKLLVAGCIAVGSFPAFAQSSVTLYGIIDEGLLYTNNAGGHASYQLASGYANGSRFGLKGAEDLGGGLKAIFQLENGFNVNSGKLGQGGLMFGRQAYVGLSSTSYGSLTLGRQYDSVVDYLGQTTANGAWAGLAFAHPYDNDNTDNSFRVNNTVKYASPNLSGLQFGGTYSFSNDTNFANDRVYSVGTQYATGNLLLAAAYLQANNPSATAGGAITNAGDQNFLAKRLQIFGAGVKYTFGSATFGLTYTNTYMTDPVSSVYAGAIKPPTGTLSSLRFNNFEVNTKYQVTPAFFVGAMYVYTRTSFNATSGDSRPDYHTAGLMADYFLSKRTDVYLQGVYQHVAGDKTGTSLDNANVVGSAAPSSTPNQFAFRAALRHRF